MATLSKYSHFGWFLRIDHICEMSREVCLECRRALVSLVHSRRQVRLLLLLEHIVRLCAGLCSKLFLHIISFKSH